MGTTPFAPSNVAFDPSCFNVRWHLSVFPFQKLAMPEEALKQELIVPIGEQYPLFYTPGVIEPQQAECEMLAVQWAKFLAVLPDPISSAVFPITGNQRHPTVTSSYSVILDECGIVGTKEEIEAGEKANRVTFKLRVMRKLMRGADGVWKGLARRPGQVVQASAAAQALMRF